MESRLADWLALFPVESEDAPVKKLGIWEKAMRGTRPTPVCRDRGRLKLSHEYVARLAYISGLYKAAATKKPHLSSTRRIDPLQSIPVARFLVSAARQPGDRRGPLLLVPA